MTAITIRKHVSAPPERVFALASNFPEAASNVRAIERVEMLTPGPVGKGTRFRETRRVMGRSATEELEVTAFEPPHRYALGAESHGCRYLSELRFTASGDGTDVEMVFEAQPLTVVSRLLALVAGPMLKKVADECSRDLEDLKRAAEA